MQLIAKAYTPLGLQHSGYISSGGDKVVKLAGAPASLRIYLLSADTMSVEQVTISLPNGHFIFMGLNPDKKYLAIARDHNEVYEAASWDYLVAAQDRTISQQQALWQSWQK